MGRKATVAEGVEPGFDPTLYGGMPARAGHAVRLPDLPPDIARSLQLALKVALGEGQLGGDVYRHTAAFKAKLDYEILRAERAS